jgi:ADP-ribosyl-[dinitrogen reductase] hydrolase
MDAAMRSRIRGCALGAAVGDALGMPLEFGPPQPADRLVREMRTGRLPAGTFTDDTEMALGVAESLLSHCPLDPEDLAQRLAAWYQSGPDDVGIHTAAVLSRIAGGEAWNRAADAVQRRHPESAGNGSVMRCWPVALTHWDDLQQLAADSRLQSCLTHPHPECQAGSELVNVVIYHLLRGIRPQESVERGLRDVDLPEPVRRVVEEAPRRRRDQLVNSGWVRHTLESAFWGLLTTHCFEDAVVQVANLGNDADTAATVAGALAGAAYGLEAISDAWLDEIQGEWPLASGTSWRAADLIALADRLSAHG